MCGLKTVLETNDKIVLVFENQSALAVYDTSVGDSLEEFSMHSCAKRKYFGYHAFAKSSIFINVV